MTKLQFENLNLYCLEMEVEEDEQGLLIEETLGLTLAVGASCHKHQSIRPRLKYI